MFSSDLLIQLRAPEDAIESTGLLFGLRNHGEITIFAIGSETSEACDKVGIFVSRTRGEVFLTESNLGLFEKEQADVALVVAGGKAGFFVREFDGSIQSVRSHEEFSIPRQAPATVFSNWKWAWPAAALAALALLLPMFSQQPLRLPGLRVSEEREQLHIAWKPGQHAVLEIVDGEERLAIPVSADQSSATYARRTSRVEISLIALDGKPARPETQHFEGLAPAPAWQAYSEFVDARAQLDRLQAEGDEKRLQADSLQKAIVRLLSERAIQQQ